MPRYSKVHKRLRGVSRAADERLLGARLRLKAALFGLGLRCYEGSVRVGAPIMTPDLMVGGLWAVEIGDVSDRRMSLLRSAGPALNVSLEDCDLERVSATAAMIASQMEAGWQPQPRVAAGQTVWRKPAGIRIAEPSLALPCAKHRSPVAARRIVNGKPLCSHCERLLR